MCSSPCLDPAVSEVEVEPLPGAFLVLACLAETPGRPMS